MQTRSEHSCRISRTTGLCQVKTRQGRMSVIADRRKHSSICCRIRSPWARIPVFGVKNAGSARRYGHAPPANQVSHECWLVETPIVASRRVRWLIQQSGPPRSGLRATASRASCRRSGTPSGRRGWRCEGRATPEIRPRLRAGARWRGGGGPQPGSYETARKQQARRLALRRESVVEGGDRRDVRRPPSFGGASLR